MKSYVALGNLKNGCDLTLPQETLLSQGKWELAVSSIVYLGQFDEASAIVLQVNICHSDYINFQNVLVDCKTILQQHLSHTTNQSSAIHFQLAWHPVNRASQLINFSIKDASTSVTTPKTINKDVLCNIHFFLRRIA